MTTQSEMWHVRLPNGETRRLSLDELDAAFNDGTINEDTPVLPGDAFTWTTLGQAAGLDNPQTPPPVSVSMPNSIAPIALDNVRDVPIDIDLAFDRPSDADTDAFRPRRGRKIFRALIVLSVIGGLGFAGFRARPMVQHALASRAAAQAPAPVVAPPPPPALPPPPPPPAPVVTAAPPPPEPAKDATPKKPDAKDAKAKRGPLKRPK
jgi:hypothetical protein